MDNDKRIHVIDSLRGFALVGILYLHTLAFFFSGALPESFIAELPKTPFDQFLVGTNYWLGMSKFFSIFSFLFGMSFYIQMQSRQKRGGNFYLHFSWRMVLLGCFGLFHWFFFTGDILAIYAVVGLLLLPLAKLSNKVLLFIAVLLFLSAGRALSFAIFQGQPIFFGGNWEVLYANHMDALINGTYWDSYFTGIKRFPALWEGQLTYWARFYTTLAYFLIGFVVARLGWFTDISKHLYIFKRILIFSAVAAVLTTWAHLEYVGGKYAIFDYTIDSYQAVIPFSVFDMQCVAFTFLYTSGFVLLSHKFNEFKGFRYLESYGRTALTSYITQSILGGFILFNWGLGLIDELSTSETIWVFLTILIIQISFCHYWLKHYIYGPLEWVWRSLTYFKWVPNKK